MIYPENYPTNYDWLPVEKQDAILKSLDFAYNKIKQWEQERKKLEDKDDDYFTHTKRISLDNRISHGRSELHGRLDMLYTMGIIPERGWVGFGDSYFLCTQGMAEMELEWQLSLKDDE